MLKKNGRSRLFLNAFLTASLFLFAANSNACLMIFDGQTGAVSGNPIGSFGEEVIPGTNRWCSTGGSYDNPVGCLQSCATGCNLSWQRQQCVGSDVIPSACGTGKFPFDPADPNCTRWSGCTPPVVRDCAAVAGDYAHQCCRCPSKTSPRWTAMTYAEQLICDPSTPAPTPSGVPSPVPSPVPSSVPSATPSGGPPPAVCEIDPLDPNLGAGCVCKTGYTQTLSPIPPAPVPSGSPLPPDCTSNAVLGTPSGCGTAAQYGGCRAGTANYCSCTCIEDATGVSVSW